MKKLFILILAVFLLSGCEKYTPSSPAVYTSIQKSSPPAKTYSFSYGIKGDNFETISKLNNMTFSHQYYCIESKMPNYPQLFVFECSIKDKVPIITVPYTSSVKDIIAFAKEAGEIDLPVLIDLFPYDDGIGPQYSSNYETAYKLLKKFSTNTKIIRSYPIGYKNPDTSDCDYEGIKYYEDDTFNSIERTSMLNDLYSDTPCFIFFGINRYSNASNSYDTFQAGKFLPYFYNDICSHVPNIKAVVYSDCADNKNDYRIDDIPEMVEAYKNIKNNNATS